MPFLDPAEAADVMIATARQALGDPAAALSGVKLLAGGTMHEAWAMTNEAPAGKRELIVRASPPGRDDRDKTRMEYAAMTASFKRGVLVPEPFYCGENDRGQSFMLTERSKGDSNPGPLLSSPEFEGARKAIVPQLAENLAKIHTLLPEDLGPVVWRTPPLPAGADPLVHAVEQQLEQYERVRLNAYPAVVWALRRIGRVAATLPRRDAPAHVVHGDFRIGNIMYDQAGLTGILDWEGVHIGEAEEDLTWVCTRVWRFNKPQLPAGGITDRETWIRAYEAASGRAIDRQRFALWEALQNVRWVVICMMQALQHLDGSVPSHELAAIGRRTAETELEVLRLLAPRNGGKS